MELHELISELLSKGVEHLINKAPLLLSRKEVSREDLSLVLSYATLLELRSMGDRLGKELGELRKEVVEMRKEVSELRREVAEMRKEVVEMRRDLVDRIDLVSNQLRILNSNIASTYELVSKIMAKLMERSLSGTL